MNAEKLAMELERMQLRNSLRVLLAAIPRQPSCSHDADTRARLKSQLLEEDVADWKRFPELYPGRYKAG